MSLELDRKHIKQWVRDITTTVVVEDSHIIKLEDGTVIRRRHCPSPLESKDHFYIGFYDVPCPTCGANPGKFCRGKIGRGKIDCPARKWVAKFHPLLIKLNRLHRV